MSLDLKVYASLIGKRYFKGCFFNINMSFNFNLQKTVEFRYFVHKLPVKLRNQPFAQLCSTTTQEGIKVALGGLNVIPAFEHPWHLASLKPCSTGCRMERKEASGNLWKESDLLAGLYRKPFSAELRSYSPPQPPSTQMSGSRHFSPSP